MTLSFLEERILSATIGKKKNIARMQKGINERMNICYTHTHKKKSHIERL